MSMKINEQILSTEAYKIGTLQSTYQSLLSEGIDIINCTIGDPKDETPFKIREALLNSISNRTNSQYPSYTGTLELKKAITNSLNTDYKIKLDPDTMVISCNGTKEAIYSIPQLFDWSNNETILIPSLSYPVYQMAANYQKIPYEYLPLSEETKFLPELSKISEETLQNTQLFWINSPHNPTTTIAPKEYLEQLIELAEKYQFIICSDECYNDLYYEDQPTSILSFDSEHWICFRSLSKRSHMTGYRSGAVISRNNDIITNLKKMRSPMGVGTPSFIQDAAICAWNDTQHVIEHQNIYKKKRDKLIHALNQNDINVFGATAGFYLWASSKDHSSSESLANWFLQKNILVTPGTVFGPDGNPYVRMVYCQTDDIIDKICANILE